VAKTASLLLHTGFDVALIAVIAASKALDIENDYSSIVRSEAFLLDVGRPEITIAT
jgi:hypothetical protein